MMWEVITAYETETGGIGYARLEVRGRMTWKTRRIAEKHAREFKAKHLRDSWVQAA